jgi:hypothetical protein
MEEINVNKTIIKNIGKFCELTRNDKSMNSQVKVFEKQQLEEDQEVKTNIMNKIQKIILTEAKTLKKK